MPSKSKGKKAMGSRRRCRPRRRCRSARRAPGGRREDQRHAQALGEEVRREARNQLEADVEPEQSAGNANNNVSGKSDAACISPAKGWPSPSKKFHHGRCPCKRSIAERWPRGWVMKPTFGSIIGRPHVMWHTVVEMLAVHQMGLMFDSP